jgi:hypothetical protein
MFDDAIESSTEPGLGLEFGCIGQAQICKYVAAASHHCTGHELSHAASFIPLLG